MLTVLEVNFRLSEIFNLVNQHRPNGRSQPQGTQPAVSLFMIDVHFDDTLSVYLIVSYLKIK